MKGKSLTKLAFSNLLKRKLRSWLTMLGVIIGVASIVVLVSLATGVNQNISSRLNTFGANVLQILPGGVRATNMGMPGMGAVSGAGGSRPSGNFDPSVFGREQATLTISDERLIKQIDGVNYASGTMSDRVPVSYKTKNSSLTLIGVDPLSYWKLATTNITSGRLLSSQDTYSAIVGSDVYNQTFQENLLNKYITIKNISFRVVGELAPSSQSFSSTDRAVIIPMSVAKRILNKSTFDTIIVGVNPEFDSEAVQEDITTALLLAHHVVEDEQDFNIQSQESVQSTISQITGTLSLFLGGIGAISLLVGAIGVANTMFMSVLERTKEIGILKAIGMTNNNVVTMFLIESALIGFIGGILGIILSFAASFVLSYFGLPSVITLELALAAVFFSAIVGIVSGIAPARSAASLEPIQALSYE